MIDGCYSGTTCGVNRNKVFGILVVTNRSLPPLLYYLIVFGYPGLASAVAAVMLLPALCIVLVLERRRRELSRVAVRNSICDPHVL